MDSSPFTQNCLLRFEYFRNISWFQDKSWVWPRVVGCTWGDTSPRSFLFVPASTWEQEKDYAWMDYANESKTRSRGCTIKKTLHAYTYKVGIVRWRCRKGASDISGEVFWL
jgi:hypothetical protein